MIVDTLLIFTKENAVQLWNSPGFYSPMLPYFSRIMADEAYYALIVMRLEENLGQPSNTVPEMMQQLASVIVCGSIDLTVELAIIKELPVPFDWQTLPLSQMPVFTGPLDLDIVITV